MGEVWRQDAIKVVITGIESNGEYRDGNSNGNDNDNGNENRRKPARSKAHTNTKMLW